MDKRNNYEELITMDYMVNLNKIDMKDMKDIDKKLVNFRGRVGNYEIEFFDKEMVIINEFGGKYYGTHWIYRCRSDINILAKCNINIVYCDGAFMKIYIDEEFGKLSIFEEDFANGYGEKGRFEYMVRYGVDLDKIEFMSEREFYGRVIWAISHS